MNTTTTIEVRDDKRQLTFIRGISLDINTLASHIINVSYYRIFKNIMRHKNQTFSSKELQNSGMPANIV